MNNYTKRLARAQQKHPELFPPGIIDTCIQHDNGCYIFSGGDCNCVPVVTITTPSGKYGVQRNGDCLKLGVEAETLPVIYDPRTGELN